MISELIYKYLANEATEEEVLLVFEWIETSKKNKKQFITLKQAWAISAFSGNIWSNKPKELQKIVQKKIITFFKYAAILLVLIALGKSIFFGDENKQSSKEIVLELSNGNIEYITKDNQRNILNAKGDLIARKYAAEIVYQGKVADEKVNYNTLKIPYGKRYKITLSDGTVVTLNSGTTLKYPEQFGINGKRKVYLTGEAFFDVAKDKQHPFIVHSDEVAIEVLGTKFNVTAYPDDNTLNSVLIEGSIRMYENENPSNNIILAPDEKVIWKNNSKKFSKQTVDSGFYTAWIKGELAFKDTPFITITKIIERAYDVTIINDNTDLAHQNFTGTINIKESSVENILELLKRDTPFKYSRKLNTITITNQ
ncbi:FecR family protein [Flavobacterium sp. LS1R49]|uniref:FecR family protein n=1 Tax=Flavobacterium shii TaxID=2987687 RepID=A0A9X2Z9W8_9FLAO|nr:FecR family protein [Flavobacterium shii]MCV9927061.1 FecR family protein [Flavobacterium shii]